MAKFANGSIEKSILLDLKAHAALDKRMNQRERRNSKRSRAHRLDVFSALDAPTCAARLHSIREVLGLLDHGYVEQSNALSIIHNISKGE